MTDTRRQLTHDEMQRVVLHTLAEISDHRSRIRWCEKLIVALVLIVLLLALCFLTRPAYGGEPLDNAWRLFDPATASATYGRDNSGRLSLSYGVGPVRLESFAEYADFDHTNIGITIEAVAPLFIRDAIGNRFALFAAPLLTVDGSPDGGPVGGETALRAGFLNPEGGDGWGWCALNLRKVTNGAWSFGFDAAAWFRCEDWLQLGGVFGFADTEGPSAVGNIGARLRFELPGGASVVAGFDWVVHGDYGNSDHLPDLGFDEAFGVNFDGQPTGATFAWFVGIEWRA